MQPKEKPCEPGMRALAPAAILAISIAESAAQHHEQTSIAPIEQPILESSGGHLSKSLVEPRLCDWIEQTASYGLNVAGLTMQPGVWIERWPTSLSPVASCRRTLPYGRNEAPSNSL